MTEEFQKGWDAAFDAISDYVEKEVCIITAKMIRRMKDEKWRYKFEELEEDDNE